jgi:K+-transporting ATPase ATPase B chain
MTTMTQDPAVPGLDDAPAPRRPRGLGAVQLRAALPEALRKLDPRVMWHNPVMFVVEVGAALTTVLAVAEPFLGGPEPSGGTPTPVTFTAAIAAWLWLTVVFANLAEAVAEGRGKAQADSLRRTRSTTRALLVVGYDAAGDPGAERARTREVASPELALGDVVVVTAGELVPGDGDVVHGIASVDESAITGESAPVVRESGGDRSAVTGGTRVLSDRIVVRITSKPGETFVDRMIALVEGAARQRTPNEIALNILLASLSIVFVVVALTLAPIAGFAGAPVSVPVLVALLVCLIPTTIGALLSAIGIAGMDRLVQRSRPPGTSPRCCWTRPGRSRTGTGGRWRSCRWPGWTRPTWCGPPRWRRPRTRRRRGGRSWTWPVTRRRPRAPVPRPCPSPRRPG